MQKGKTTLSVTEEVEVIDKTVYCCDGLKMVLEYADGHNHNSGRPLAGIQHAHVFSTKGGYVYSPIVCALPSRGQGKKRIKGTNVIVAYCPFCGVKQKGRPG
jgi:hypothetical protein